MPLNGRPKELKNGETLPPVFPNAGMQAVYNRKLQKMIKEMHESTLFWVNAAWNAETPAMTEIAMDELSANLLERVIRHLTKRWNKNFKVLAVKTAKWAANKSDKAVTAQFARQLEKYGWSFDFKMTRAMQDALAANIFEQTRLITSIPQKYLESIQGQVMRAVQKGGDKGQLAKQLEKSYGVTKRRARAIARDQVAKSFATVTQARRLELGITEAIWMHSYAGKEPRKSHVHMNGKKFDVAKGMYDPHEKRFIQPHELINCRCSSRSVIPLE